MWQDNNDKILDILDAIEKKNAFLQFVLYVEEEKGIYTFTDIRRVVNEEVCGRGVVPDIIAHTLCTGYRNGGKIQKKFVLKNLQIILIIQKTIKYALMSGLTS